MGLCAYHYRQYLVQCPFLLLSRLSSKGGPRKTLPFHKHGDLLQHPCQALLKDILQVITHIPTPSTTTEGSRPIMNKQAPLVSCPVCIIGSNCLVRIPYILFPKANLRTSYFLLRLFSCFFFLSCRANYSFINKLIGGLGFMQCFPLGRPQRPFPPQCLCLFLHISPEYEAKGKETVLKSNCICCLYPYDVLLIT